MVNEKFFPARAHGFGRFAIRQFYVDYATRLQEKSGASQHFNRVCYVLQYFVKCDHVVVGLRHKFKKSPHKVITFASDLMWAADLGSGSKAVTE